MRGLSKTRTPVSICSTCSLELDMASGKRGTSPKEGDVSICKGCGQLAKFDKDLKLIPIEIEDLGDDYEESLETIREAQLLIIRAHKRT